MAKKARTGSAGGRQGLRVLATGRMNIYTKAEGIETISLLNVEGKVFFAVLARRMTTFLTVNQYNDTSVQKGGVPWFSGCLEHTSDISQIIREAKVNNKDTTVIWLDLANAYGSISHKLIDKALKYYYIPEHIQVIINGYVGGLQLRFSGGEQTTPWQRLEEGIVTGCTISVVLFVMNMNLLINAAKRETRGPTTASGIHLPYSRGFMDDLTISTTTTTTTTYVQARCVLTPLDDTVNWARLNSNQKNLEA